MERQSASSLLSIGAVFLRPEQPFTWASGIKSPIYCDNRLTLSAPRVREQVENGLAKLVKRHFPDCEMLMGTSTAGIAHAGKDDQVRITTPARAREIGSDFIVVGRPITAAEDPVAAYERCVKEFLSF